MRFRYLGYGKTDNNGIAKLDHDVNGDIISHSYTGVGAGEIDVVSSLDNPSAISESSDQSEPYEVTDCIYYDPVTSDTKDNYYINTNGGTSKAYDSTNNRMVITLGSDSGRWYVDCRTSNSALDLSALLGKTVRFNVYIGGVSSSKGIKLVVNGANSPNETSYFTEEGYHYIDVTIPSDATLIRFTLSPKSSEWSQNDSYWFKDFTVYPI